MVTVTGAALFHNHGDHHLGAELLAGAVGGVGFFVAAVVTPVGVTVGVGAVVGVGFTVIGVDEIIIGVATKV